MKIRCKYCESYINEYEEKCPNCGSTNEDLKRVGNEVPTTIEELKKWYTDHNLPDENITRFFIGKNIQEARAFGIYKDNTNGNFVVYKNKDTGERAVRYEGKDETYAVNELYLKLKEEILNQKTRNIQKKNSSTDVNEVCNIPLLIIHIVIAIVSISLTVINWIAPLFMFISLILGILITILLSSHIKNKKTVKLIDTIWHLVSIIMFILILVIPPKYNEFIHKDDGYYTKNSSYYYHYGKDWYLFTDGDWKEYNGSTNELDYAGNDYSNNYEVTNFEDSSYYENDRYWETSFAYTTSGTGSSSSSSHDSWDSSSTWDSNDSWDSPSTDWSSDW